MNHKPPFDIQPLLVTIEHHQSANQASVSQILQLAESLLEAARRVEDSWSGSCMGYHWNLYYGDFQQPPREHRFNVEWGGIRGLPPGWQPRRPEDVKARIESLATAQFVVLEREDHALAKSVDQLRTEIVTALAPLRSLADLENENELLKELDTLDWGDKEKKEYVVNVVKSSPHSSRDSAAIMEGLRIPTHTYWEAIAYQAQRHCQATETLWKTAMRILKQLQEHQGAAGPIESVPTALGRAKSICTRFHLVAKQLKHRHAGRPTVEIQDEYDVQDLLHALLRLEFDDVRPEEWTPSYGGAAARMDFLLKGEGIVVEAKMTRRGRAEKVISDELIIDAVRYKEHPNCATLMCFIYDPAGTIKNPRGLEADLSKLGGNKFSVAAIIAP